MKAFCFQGCSKASGLLLVKDTPWAGVGNRGSKQRHRASEEALNLMVFPRSQGRGEESLKEQEKQS